MKFYYTINEGKKKVYINGVHKDTKSRIGIYKIFGKEFSVGYMRKITPNEVYAEPQDTRIPNIVAGSIIALLTLPLLYGAVSLIIVSVAVIFSISAYKEEKRNADNFNRDVFDSSKN